MRILLITLIVIVALSLILYLYCHFENSKFNITEFDIYSDKIKKDMTIAVIADLHNYEYGDDNSRLMLAFDMMKPDMIISAGDMVEAGQYAKGTKRTIAFLKRVSEKYPFFYGIGNHEHMLLERYYKKYNKVSDELDEALLQNNIAIKRNEKEILQENNVSIASLEIEKKYYRKFKLNPIDGDYITNRIGEIDCSYFNIVVGHDPNQIKAYGEYGADLVLSGHVHGGMIALPNGRGLVSTLFTPFPPYYAGAYEEKNTTMIVSRGIGNHSVHIRINNRAELLKINLKRKY